jgi:transcriptional regulator with XRE-family HTH domain
MSTIHERIQQLRESTGLGRTRWARFVGISARALSGIEYEGRKPGADILAAIAEKYPQHILWILTGKADPKVGQTRPSAVARARKTIDS